MVAPALHLLAQMIKFESPAHSPFSMTVTTAAASRMDPPNVENITPPHPKLIDAARPLNFPGSEGFLYQAEAVTAAVAAGKTECEEFTTAESLATAALCDAILGDLGVSYVV